MSKNEWHLHVAFGWGRIFTDYTLSMPPRLPMLKNIRLGIPKENGNQTGKNDRHGLSGFDAGLAGQARPAARSPRSYAPFDARVRC